MELFKQIIKESNIVPLLRLVIKKEGGGTNGTGKHIVKILDAKEGVKMNYDTHEKIPAIWILIEENGEKKKYPIPKFGEDGGPHYLVERFSEFEVGDTISMEFKRKGIMGYIEVCPVDVKVKEEKTEDIPVADESVDDLLSGTPEPKIEDVPF